jgi:outer membrane receptor for ferrienterochelin and colicin
MKRTSTPGTPWLSLAALLLGSLVASTLTAQTTGALVGRAADESGGVLPGVNVEAKSPALQGSRVVATDGSGRYRLTLLPPGVYTVVFALPGFASETRAGVTVSLGNDTTLDAVLRPAATAEVVVTGEAPVVDTGSTSLGTNLTSRTIETLPTGRNYSSVVQVVPGTSSDADPKNASQSTITVYGSSGAENSFYIDGVNTTGIEYCFQGKELNYEFIQEINVKTGGYEAEFGRSTGAVINVITKSGSNEFHGDAFGYLDENSLRASAKPVVSTGGTVTGFKREDYGAAVGGPIWKDRIWFFAAYDRVHNTTDNVLEGVSSESVSTRNLGSGKLTFHLGDSHSVVLTGFQDPTTDTGAINDSNHTLNGDPLTYEGRQDVGGQDYAGRYEGIFGSHFTAAATISRHTERNSVGPATAEGDVIQYQDAANDFFQTGGFGLIQLKNFKRTAIGGSISPYFGNHAMKLGVEYEKEEADVIKRNSGGQLVTIFANDVHPNLPIYQHGYWTTPDATVDNAPISQLNASPSHKNMTFYLQDRWTVLPSLTLNLGIRWDHQQIIDASDVKQIDLKHDWAPRVGVVWDPTNDHRSKVFASYGRFYEQIPMDLVIRSFSYERQPRIINYSPTDFHPNANAESDYGTGSAILGGFTEPSDPNIHGQYLSEYIVGGEREVITDLAVGVKGIYRDYGNVIEDFLCADDGTYCIGNPGKGIMTQVFGLDYTTLYPAPRPIRIYRGVQLDVTKRFSHNWSALASYIYSTLDGNYDGEYSPFTQTTINDPNISAAYDYYDFFTDGRDLSRITNRGPLSNDRRHQFKVSGVWLSPWKLSVGLAAYYRTGTPLTRYGYSDAYGRYEFFLTDRGAEGRTPDNYEADVHFGYPLGIGPVTVNFLLDVFNILNAQRPVLLDERWGFQEADNASPTPVNPNYKKPVFRTPPTSARLGVRVSF